MKALHGSDILSIHLPYDSSTSGLIGEKQILEMNKLPKSLGIIGAKNVLITPHIGGCTYESMEATESFIAEKFVNILKEQQ